MYKKYRFLKILFNGSIVFDNYAVKKSYFIFYKFFFQSFLILKKMQGKKSIELGYKKKYYAGY